MKKRTLFLLLISCTSICIAMFAAERSKPIPNKELSNPHSQFHIPFPYPKTKKQIVANVKFQAKEKKTLMKILETRADKYIIKTIEVKNRIADYADDYFWLIIIMDKKKRVYFRILMYADGRTFGGATWDIGKKKNFQAVEYYKEESDVLKELSTTQKKKLTPHSIKYIGRLAFSSRLDGSPPLPMWQIVLNDGRIFYYAISRNSFFKVTEELPWNDKDWTGPGKSYGEIRDLAPFPYHFVIDTIGDKILIMKPL
ncbi:MAG: hypothetical protein GY757_61365 [bacterium]|nr:hypothetical protein [bacterium]